MRNIETKTEDDVREIVVIAMNNGIEFNFYDKPNTNLCWTSNIELDKKMSPSKMYSAIKNKLQDKGILIHEPFYNEIKAMVNKS